MSGIDNTNQSPIQQLLSMLQAPKDIEDELKPENLRFVMYVRKSSIDESKQLKSKSDQISECFDKIIKPLNIKITDKDIVQEDGSAKEPDIRPKFRKMLEDIISGKYNAICAWHVDRLARNMREAGEIIDLLDKGVIKDLRFVTSQFDNSPAGKMLLGISFVLSKEYSEKLSVDIRRGNKHKTSDGKFLRTFLHEYIKTEDGFLYPDGENFNIIRSSFELRIEGQTQNDILNYLKSRTDYRIFKYKASGPGGHYKYRWTKDNVSSMLSDPTYAGILKYSGAVVNLIELYGFTPTIEAEDFLKINKVSSFSSNRFKSSIIATKPKVHADLLRGLVYCFNCNKSMSSGITTKKAGHELYYRYRCETDGCIMKNKGPRASIVTDYALGYLDKYRFTTKHNYENYTVEVRASRQKKLKELNRIINSLDKQILSKRKDYDNARRIAADKDNKLQKYYIDDLETYSKEINSLKGVLQKAKDEKERNSKAIINYERYLELFDNVSSLLRKTKSIKQMDKVLRIFFSNLTLKGESIPPKNTITRWKVVSIKLNEPYSVYISNNDFGDGGAYRT